MKKARLVIAALVFVLGAGLIAYPYVSDYVHRQEQHGVITIQEETVEETDDSALREELARAQDYNERLLSSKTVVTDPFDPDALGVTDEEYESLLNLGGDGVMGTLVIPKIDLQMPIYHYTNDEELQAGVGHMESTSLPVGGESTHAVLAGHNGLPSVKIFDRLDELEVGDYFVIEVLGEEHAYRVTSKETVLPEETDSLTVVDDADLVTLVTCTPNGVNTHRLLVHAERCELPASWDEVDREATEASAAAPDVPLLEFTLLGLAVATGLLVAWALARRARRGNGRLAGPGGGGRHGRARGGSRSEGSHEGRHFSTGPDTQGRDVPAASHTRAQGVLPVRPTPRGGRRSRHG